ncbi:MAG: HEAT repeat domain-containing protein [Bacillota bacterium]
MENTYTTKLIQALWHPDPRIRRDAAWLLGKKKVKEAAQMLIAAIDENKDDPYLLSTIAEALGQIGEPDALLPLGKLLLSSYLPVRVKAARALAQLGDPRAVAYLARALEDPNSCVRWAASGALEKLESATRQTEI